MRKPGWLVCSTPRGCVGRGSSMRACEREGEWGGLVPVLKRKPSVDGTTVSLVPYDTQQPMANVYNIHADAALSLSSLFLFTPARTHAQFAFLRLSDSASFPFLPSELPGHPNRPDRFPSARRSYFLAKPRPAVPFLPLDFLT